MQLDTYLKSLDDKTETILHRIMQWSNINSNTYNLNGLLKMTDALTTAFADLECQAESISVPAIQQINSKGQLETVELGSILRFRKRPEAPIQVLLVGHMDTVYGVDHPFQQAVRTADNKIVGPGVTDMKGGLCIMLEALKCFEKNQTSNSLGWEVLINSDEEIGSLGSAAILAEHAKQHQVGLIFEPAMDEKGTLAGERKGSGKFTIVVRGRAAHAGRDFAKGRNAITAMARVISEIDALNGTYDGVTINVGHIEGGGSINVVPDLAICRLDVRVQEKIQEPWVMDHLTNIIKTENQLEGIILELQGFFTRSPKMITGKTKTLYELVKTVGEELGQTISWQPSGGVSDGNTLSEAGLPNVDSLGVCGNKIHSQEEYCLIESLVPRVKLASAILFRLSEGAL